MKTWCRYNKREDEDEDEKLYSVKLVLISEFCKQ